MLRHTLFADQNGLPDAVITAIPDWVNALSLSASTQKTDTAPAGARFVRIISTVAAYTRFGAAAAIPGDTTDGSASELISGTTPIFRSIERIPTTGTVAAASAALVVASTDGMTKGNTIIVAGADTAGADLTTTISAINVSTKTVTLAAAAVTAVTSAVVSLPLTSISVISAATCIVTLSYFK